jgi:hypothetical protein
MARFFLNSASFCANANLALAAAALALAEELVET